MSWMKQQVKKILPNPLFEIREYWKAHGEWPNIIRPVTFNEKVLHRRLFDRRALLSQLADKAAVRLYVQARLGAQILPELYYLTVNPDSIPFDELPNRFVVKQRPQPPDPLPTYFDSIVFDSAGLGPVFVLRCKVCHGEWKLSIKNQDPGYIQTILNHAHSHPKTGTTEA